MENRPRKNLPTWKLAVLIVGGMGVWILFLVFISFRSEPISLSPEYLCSLRQGDGKIVQYFELHQSGFQELSLAEQVETAVVFITPNPSGAGWDRAALCSGREDVEWQAVSVGSECGMGARISPCAAGLRRTNERISSVVLGPTLNGYTSSQDGLFRKNALVKVVGK